MTQEEKKYPACYPTKPDYRKIIDESLRLGNLTQQDWDKANKLLTMFPDDFYIHQDGRKKWSRIDFGVGFTCTIEH